MYICIQKFFAHLFCRTQFNSIIQFFSSIKKTPDLGHYLRGCIDTQWWKKAFFGLKISLKVSECSLFQCGYQHELLMCCTCTAPSRPGLNVSARRRPSQQSATFFLFCLSSDKRPKNCHLFVALMQPNLQKHSGIKKKKKNSLKYLKTITETE